jgi:hypothetical protein
MSFHKKPLVPSLFSRFTGENENISQIKIVDSIISTDITASYNLDDIVSHITNNIKKLLVL